MVELDGSRQIAECGLRVAECTSGSDIHGGHPCNRGGGGGGSIESPGEGSAAAGGVQAGAALTVTSVGRRGGGCGENPVDDR